MAKAAEKEVERAAEKEAERAAEKVCQDSSNSRLDSSYLEAQKTNRLY